MRSLVALLLGIACGSAHAELLASQGTAGILSVQYEYSSTGKKTDKDEPGEWRVQRTINLIVPMTADRPQPVSSLRPRDSAQTADLAKKQAATLGKPAGPRYQLWQPVSQKGTYLVDEMYRAQTSDPLCLGKPNHRCKREETRKGGGDIPVPSGAKTTSAALLEVDSLKQDVFIKLPVPMSALGYSRQVTSDYPDEKSGTSSGTLPGMAGQQKSITAVISGDLRLASGTQSFKVDGAEGEGGTLVVKWQFALQ